MKDDVIHIFINGVEVNETKDGSVTVSDDLSDIRSLNLTSGAASGDDTDGDGLPDAWEQQIIDADGGDGINSIADVDPNSDFDGDGETNLSEFLGGTDPADCASRTSTFQWGGIDRRRGGRHGRCLPDSAIQSIPD